MANHLIGARILTDTINNQRRYKGSLHHPTGCKAIHGIAIDHTTNVEAVGDLTQNSLFSLFVEQGTLSWFVMRETGKIGSVTTCG
jgi:hypothetical protein